MDLDGGADILKQFDSRHVPSHVAALLTLKANWLDTLTVKQWGIMMNNDVQEPISDTERNQLRSVLFSYWR